LRFLESRLQWFLVKTFEVLKTKTKTLEVFRVKTFEVLKTSKVKFEFKLRKMLYFVPCTLYLVLL